MCNETPRIRPSGDTAWVRVTDCAGLDYDRAYAVATYGQNGVAVTGTFATAGTLEDYATLVYDSSGALLWTAQ